DDVGGLLTRGSSVSASESPQATEGTFFFDSETREVVSRFCEEHLALLNRVGAPTTSFIGPRDGVSESLPPTLIFSIRGAKNGKMAFVLERNWLETKRARRALAGMLVVFLDQEPFKPPTRPAMMVPVPRHLPKKPTPKRLLQRLISDITKSVARLKSSNSVISFLADCQVHIALVPIEDPAWDCKQLKAFLDQNVKPRVERFCPEFLQVYETRTELPPIVNLEEEYKAHLQSSECPFSWGERYDRQTDEGRRLEAAINLAAAKQFRWGLVNFHIQLFDQLEMVGDTSRTVRGTGTGDEESEDKQHALPNLFLDDVPREMKNSRIAARLRGRSRFADLHRYIGESQLFFLWNFAISRDQREYGGEKVTCCAAKALARGLKRWADEGLFVLTGEDEKDPIRRLRKNWSEFVRRMDAVPEMKGLFITFKDPRDRKTTLLAIRLPVRSIKSRVTGLAHLKP
ncbi:MAG: hypothetical protein ABIH26_07185, partial [Candidatus Eisenbacteria bacterium]